LRPSVWSGSDADLLFDRLDDAARLRAYLAARLAPVFRRMRLGKAPQGASLCRSAPHFLHEGHDLYGVKIFVHCSNFVDIAE
jgi:hypothetical protein